MENIRREHKFSTTIHSRVISPERNCEAVWIVKMLYFMDATFIIIIITKWEAAHMGRHSRLPIAGLLCGLGGPGSICYSGDGGIEQNCRVCWTRVRLPFPADCSGVSWPCQWVSYSLPHGAWKENSPTDRRRTWDCFSVSAFINLSAALQLRVTTWFFCPWWLPRLSVTPYIFNF